MVRPVARVQSIPKAARAIPYMLAIENEMKIVKAMQRTGTKLER
jgi:hypothetical protein